MGEDFGRWAGAPLGAGEVPPPLAELSRGALRGARSAHQSSPPWPLPRLLEILPLPLLFPLLNITLAAIARLLVDLSFDLVSLNRVVVNCRGGRTALTVSSAGGQRQRKGGQDDEKYDRGSPHLTDLPARLELETITKHRDAGSSAAAGGLEAAIRWACESRHRHSFHRNATGSQPVEL